MMASLCAEPTVYEIQSRWIPEKYLNVAADRVSTAPGGNGLARWILEPDGPAFLVRNVETGGYLRLADGVTLLTTTKDAPKDDRGRWEIDPVGPHISIRNVATGQFVNIENKDGPVDGGLENRPDAKNWWSGLWKLVHISGPKPERLLKHGEVVVTAPANGANVKGATKLEIRAPGVERVKVSSWTAGAQPVEKVVAEQALDAAGRGEVVFPADQFPHGPITIRVSGVAGGKTSNYNLMVFNEGGVAAGSGLPPAPPQAAGMKLVYADDFTGALSISKDGAGATYAAHKPGGGDFSGFPFTDYGAKGDPFLQRETWLRIRADENANTSGLISSLRFDGTGITATAPCYFECRLIAQSIPGTWPAFWIMTTGVRNGLDKPADELDVIEGYGGEGQGSPNQRGYWIATHYWNQNGQEQDKDQPGFYGQIPMTETKGGLGTTWYETFHTYGVKITKEDTIYYCDNVEVARHKTAKLSAKEPFFFFVNLAVGGGWPVDLSRYGGTADMYVDFVRVYQGK